MTIAAAVPAAAQVELTPRLGWRGSDLEVPFRGGCPEVVGFPCPVAAELAGGESFGLVADWSLAPRWMLEAHLAHRSSELEIRFVPSADFDQFGRTPDAAADLTHLHIGALRSFGDGRLRPFAAAGLGVGWLESSPLGSGFEVEPLSEVEPSATVAVGVRLAAGERLGLRLEGRGLWTRLPDGWPEDELLEVDLSTGLAWRF